MAEGSIELIYTGRHPGEGVNVDGVVYRGIDSPVFAPPDHAQRLVESGFWEIVSKGETRPDVLTQNKKESKNG